MSTAPWLRWGDRALEFSDPLWLLLAPGAIALLALAVRAARLAMADPRDERPSVALIRTATAFRIGAYLALVAALAGATLVRTLREDRIEAVVVLDVSRSISDEENEWMEGWLQNFQNQLRSDDRIAVLAFGRNPVLQVPSGPPQRATAAVGPELDPLLDRDATDLSAALAAATDLATGRGPTGVIALLTDGNETEGRALAAADEARRRGVRVFPFSPPRSGPPLWVERASGPGTARTGAETKVSVAVSNRSAETRRAEVVLRHFDKELGRMPVEVGPGGTVVDLFFRAGAPGHKNLVVGLEGARGVVAPGQLESLPLTVFGPPRILVVAPNASLGELLREAGFAVERRNDLKGIVADDLSLFHTVVIGGASARDLPTEAAAELETWVEEFGGGLVLAAASGLVGDESLKGSPLARLLPVGIERQEPKRRARLPLSLFLVIDRSSSMTGGLRADQMRPSRISYAREAALALLEQLEDRDWVGAAAFDTETSPLANLAPLTENRDELAARIAGLVPSGGTDFKDAVELAVRQLVAGPAQSRHIILLTDGASIRPRSEHDPLIAELAASDVTVTSIRIGEDAEGFDLIESISSSTGGNFHHVTDSDSLPDLMIREARRTARRDEETAGPGAIRPMVRREGIEALGSLRTADLPPLRAFADVPLRDGAEEWLGVDLAEKSAPILAAWQIGLGRVVVFTGNPSRLWQTWEKSRSFWSQLVRWTGRATSDDEVRVVRRSSDGTEEIEIETFDRHPDTGLAVRLFDRAGGSREVRPIAASPRRYTIGLSGAPALEPRIEIDLERGGRPAFIRDAWLPLEASPPALSEDPLAEPDRSLLREIARRTGGAIDATPARILRREPAERRSTQPLGRALLLAAFVLLLTDIALRQFPRS